MNFMAGERDRLGRCGRRPADRIFPVLCNFYRSAQVRSEPWVGLRVF